MSEPINVHVRARAERRCRCGMCFDIAGRTVSVTEDQLARLQADPMLVVTDTPAQESELERVADKVNQIVTDSPALEPIGNNNTGPVETLPAAAAGADTPPASQPEAPKAEATKAETPAKSDKTAAKADKNAAKAAKEAG
ncbi:hypothetical protein [Desulfovibrio falkowii]|uniref:Mu-like prophage FluMu N-terminal domain-containing protein n=1 Tax=Desulfovibrio falkowii TaxID=3136602 RepID=A0ABQ0EAB6_9BACT